MIIGIGLAGAIRLQPKSGLHANIIIPQAWKNESVYTPGFVLDGREWMGRSVPAGSNEKSGSLKLSIMNGRAISEFVPANGEPRNVVLHIALLGFDLTTKIGAGENSGRNLRQDFVVLSLANQPMSGGKTKFDFNPDPRAGAIAAWVTAQNEIEPIQAVGGWLTSQSLNH